MLPERNEYDWIEIGPVPYAEDCVQVDPKVNYLPAMRKELERFKKLLETLFPVPEGIHANYRIHWQTHEFGRYGEVVVGYDVDDPAALEFALMVESNTPERWPVQSPSARFEELINQAHNNSRVV